MSDLAGLPSDAAVAEAVDRRLASAGMAARGPLIAAEVALLGGVSVRRLTSADRSPYLLRLRDLVAWECRRAGLTASKTAAALARERSTISTALRREDRRRAGSEGK